MKGIAMKIRTLTTVCLAALACVTELSRPACAASVTFQVLFSTNGLEQGPGGLIDMQLSAASPPGSPSVSASVYGPITDGVISSGASASDPMVGTAMGDLTTPSGVSMNNTAFSEMGQDFAVRSYFDVFVTLSGSEIGSNAVGPFTGTVFQLTVFDSVLSDPGLSATFIVNPNIDGNGEPIVDGNVGFITSGDNVTVVPFAVPEPASFVLLSLGLGAIVALKGPKPEAILQLVPVSFHWRAVCAVFDLRD
jgi:hypothetical protein